MMPRPPSSALVPDTTLFLSDYSASINWGDGTSASMGSLSFSAGTYTVKGAHTYAEEGPYSISVTLHHDSATDVVVTSSATVSDPSVTATGGFPVTATEGALSGWQTVATLTDPGGADG